MSVDEGGLANELQMLKDKPQAPVGCTIPFVVN